MNKTIKIISILVLAIMLITIATNVFAAAGTTGIDPKDISASYQDDGSDLKTKAGNILGMLRNIAAIASVIILTVLGIKYMLGSVEEKAEYKKSFMPLIIGIVVVVSATTIASFIFKMAG